MKIIKLSLITLGSLLFIWFAIPVFAGIFNSGNFFGLLFSLMLITYGIFFKIINRLIAKMWHPIWGKIALITICAIAAAIIIFISVTTVLMISAANNESDQETVVIVLGCRVYESGPSNLLQNRLDAAYEYLTENTNAKCILSGGKGDDEPISEAEFMYNYLVEKGIDPNRLYVENQSTSTRENLEFSKKIIEEEGLCPTVTIITNDFHQYRASRIAKTLDMQCCSVSGKTPLYLLPTYYIRELCGVLYEIIIE